MPLVTPGQSETTTSSLDTLNHESLASTKGTLQILWAKADFSAKGTSFIGHKLALLRFGQLRPIRGSTLLPCPV